MSLASIFSSPTEQADTAATNEANLTQAALGQAENYSTAQQEAERGGIGSVGSNPYFQAAAAMNPSAYAVNPNDTVTFGNSGPGMTTSQGPGAPAPVQPSAPVGVGVPSPVGPPKVLPGPVTRKAPPTTQPLPQPIPTFPPGFIPYNPHTNPPNPSEPQAQ